MSDRYQRVARFVDGQAWAIVPEKLAIVREIVRLRTSGARLGPEEIRQRLGYVDEPAPLPRASRTGSVAVLPLYGFLCPKANMLTEYSGGTSLEAFGQWHRQALADPNVASIAIEIDSGGGSVYGAEELWAQIFAARKTKRTVAVVNPMAGSCAYWLATACEEIVVTPSGDVGSIGVYWMHEDVSGSLEQEGVKVEFVSAGAFKTEGNPYEALSTQGRAYAQAQVDATYARFVEQVAKGRGVSTAAVLKAYGQGRMVMARDAVARGMADRLGTLGETVARLVGKTTSAGTRAVARAASGPPRRARSPEDQHEHDSLQLEHELIASGMSPDRLDRDLCVGELARLRRKEVEDMERKRLRRQVQELEANR